MSATTLLQRLLHPEDLGHTVSDQVRTVDEWIEGAAQVMTWCEGDGKRSNEWLVSSG